jgi:hypothetical protein
MYDFRVRLRCWYPDWQVSFAVQILNALSQTFSAVKDLFLGVTIHDRSSEEKSTVSSTLPNGANFLCRLTT